MSELELRVALTANGKFTVVAPDERVFAFNTLRQALDHIDLSFRCYLNMTPERERDYERTGRSV